MKYVFLDTNVYLTCALMSKDDHDASLLERLNGCLDANDAKLLLPEVVQAELGRNLEVKWQWLRGSIINYKKAVKDDNPLKDLNEPNVQAAIAQIQEAVQDNLDKREKSMKATEKHLESMFSDDGKVERIALTADAMTHAMVMTLSRTGPSNAKSDMYGKPEMFLEAINDLRFKYGLEGDCLILASLVEFVNSRVRPENNRLVFCSSDSTAFANDDRDDIDPKIGALFNSEVAYYSELDEMLDKEFAVKSDEVTKTEYRSTADALRRLAEQQKAVQLAASAATIDMSAFSTLASLNTPSLKAVAGLAATPAWLQLQAIKQPLVQTPPWLEQLKKSQSALTGLSGFPYRSGGTSIGLKLPVEDDEDDGPSTPQSNNSPKSNG